MIAYRLYGIIYIMYGGRCESSQDGFKFRIQKHFYLSQNELRATGYYESGPLRAWKHFNNPDTEILVSVYECADDVKLKEKLLLRSVDFPANIMENSGLRLQHIVCPPDVCMIPLPPLEWIAPKNIVTNNFTIDELLLMLG
jgi:hypothetical protein